MTSQDKAQFVEGQVVEVVDTISRPNRVTTTGNVDRVTKSQVVVNTAVGTQMKFRLKDNLQVGYSFPIFTLAIRPKLF